MSRLLCIAAGAKSMNNTLQQEQSWCAKFWEMSQNENSLLCSLMALLVPPTMRACLQARNGMPMIQVENSTKLFGRVLFIPEKLSSGYGFKLEWKILEAFKLVVNEVICITHILSLKVWLNLLYGRPLMAVCHYGKLYLGRKFFRISISLVSK